MLVVQHDNGLHESHRVIFFTVFFFFSVTVVFMAWIRYSLARSHNNNSTNTSGFGLGVFPAGGGPGSVVGGFGLGIFPAGGGPGSAFGMWI